MTTFITNESKIYKIIKTNKDKTDAIYVFYGNYLDNENPHDLLQSKLTNQEETSFFHPRTEDIVFSQKELEKIRHENIPVFFSKQQIHLDDSIATIKIKWLQEVNNAFSMEEIYFFCQQYQTIHNVSLFQALSQSKKVKINKTRFDCFLKNIVSEDSFVPPGEKETYDYNDILELNLNDKEIKMNVILGKNNFSESNEYPFVVNPFLVSGYDESIERSTRKSLLYLNTHLLLDSGIILNNTIYLCLAGDVFASSTDDEYTAKVYYPKLYNKNVLNLEILEQKRHFFVEENEKITSNPATLKTFQNVDLFYDIFAYRKKDFDYVNHGVKSFIITIPFLFKTKIPLDVVFKLIHATKTTPLTKYNPSSRQEKIYRLYTDKMSIDGRKIPYLSKGTIFKLIKTTGKNKSVTFYLEKEGFSLFCEIEESGNMTISSEMEKILPIENIDETIRDLLNPLLEEINAYMEQSGYHIETFVSMHSSNVVVKKITYESIIRVENDFELKKVNQFKGCISSIFLVDSLDKRLSMRLKRVSHFNKRTSQEAFIIEKQKEGWSSLEIVEELQRNFPDLTHNEAIDLISKIVNELQLQRKVKKRDIEIKINPGFPVFIEQNNFNKKSNVKITVENINDLLYLQTIPIYLDSLIRLIQDKGESREIPLNQIKNLCLSKKKESEQTLEETISEYEMEEREKPNEEEEAEEDEMSDYEGSEVGEERMQYAMKFFDMDDEEEEQGEEQEGGENSDADSEKSLSDYSFGEHKEEDEDNSDFEKKEEETPILMKPKIVENKPKRINKKLVIQESDQEEDNNGETFLIEPKKKHNIDGMPLSNKNSYFQKRIKERDPVLIVSEKTKDSRYKSYARTCSSTARRQPVILNQEELEDIHKKHPGFLKDGDVVQYGSVPDKQFYYICPRYWDLKNETVVTEEEMKEKNLYDKIIPAKEKKVPKGKYIYESQKTKMYPNFQIDSHPDGYCLPCCFSKWNTETLIKRRNECSNNGNETERETEIDKKQDDYIIGPEKYPLPRDRWGYLPMAVQHLLNENSATCQISKNNTNIKPNHTCFLRHGVENNKKQSFVACIADALFYTKKDEFGQPLRKSILETKELILSTLTLDNFIQYQNGNLVNDFFDKTQETKEITFSKYQKTNIYKKLALTQGEGEPKANQVLLKKICLAFENFVRFLKDPMVTIDHTYLWDIVAEKNTKLFRNGLNLVILDIPNEDITNNVRILCPSNHYSNHTYESNKPTLILLRQENYYEPLYTYRYEKTKETIRTTVGKLFNETDSEVSPIMKTFLSEVIRPFMEKICQPEKSLPHVYKMKQPVLLEKIIEIVKKMNYEIEKQVVNYQNKVIGVVVFKESKQELLDENEAENVNETKRGFIPCYPSAILNDFEYIFMLESNIWNDYNETIAFLKEVNHESKGLLHCEIAFLIAEEEMIVGILTETNQFISLSEPYPGAFVKEEIPILKETNYILGEANMVAAEGEGDKERKKFIRKIKLESQFFSVFRNTVRILLNQYENADLRESIEEVIKDNQIIYTDKLTVVNDFLKQLVERKLSISFVENTDEKDDIFQSLDEKDIASCIVYKSSNQCNEKNPLCSYLPDLNECQLLLPRFNLIQNDSDNEVYYYARMADEIIRYSRIKSFLFQPQTYLSFNDVKYNLREDEILLLESFITQDYFEKLIPVETNTYVKYNNYDTVEPIDTLERNHTIDFIHLDVNK